MTALQQAWHVDCFKCGSCQLPIRETSYQSNGKQAFHINCKTANAANRVCAGCKEPITSNKCTNALGELWHVDCFKCNVCGGTITGDKFAVDGGKPVHLACRTTAAPRHLCSCGCLKPIDNPSDVVSAFGAKWHIDCFKCGVCGEPIMKVTEAILQGLKPYHKSCKTSEDAKMMDMGNTATRARTRARTMARAMGLPMAPTVAPTVAALDCSPANPADDVSRTLQLEQDTVVQPRQLLCPVESAKLDQDTVVHDSLNEATVTSRGLLDDDTFVQDKMTSQDTFVSDRGLDEATIIQPRSSDAPCVPTYVAEQLRGEHYNATMKSASSGGSSSLRKSAGSTAGHSFRSAASLQSTGSLASIPDGLLWVASDSVAICGGCYFLIEDADRVTVGQEDWHQSCFKCCSCGKFLNTTEEYRRNRQGLHCMQCK